MVAAIGAGLGVDYGIYMLSRINDEFKQNRDMKLAIQRAFSTTGRAVVVTGITVIMGIVLWSFSAIRFQAEMGFLLAFLLFINFISGQVFHQHIFGYNEGLCTGPYMQKPREDSFFLTFLVNNEYHMSRICPEVLAVYDTASTGWYIKPRVEFKYGDHWRPEIGALVFAGDQYELPFGDFADKDEIYFRIKYQF